MKPALTLEAKSSQERIARALCKLLDDEWYLGKRLYMETAGEMLTAIGWNELRAAGLEANHAAADYAKLIQVENFDRNDMAVHRAYERLRLALNAQAVALGISGAVQP